MRIALDISQAVYEGTGSGRYVLELIRSLLQTDLRNEYVLFGSAMRRRDQLVRLFEEFTASSKNSHLSFCSLPFPPAFFEYAWNKMHFLPIETFTKKIDVYHSSDWTQAPSRAKKVTTVHDVMPFLFPDHFHPRIITAHQERWKWISTEVDALIVDALVTKDDIIRLFSVDPAKIHVIPLACDSRFFVSGEAKLGYTKDTLVGRGPGYLERVQTVLQKYGLSESGYILTVGTQEPRKNIERLLTAYGKIDSDLQKKYPLVVVGKKAWTPSLGERDTVIFTGYVPDADLPYLYGGAACFVMPSLYEGFGLPVLEAMASGTPVVCSHCSSLPEVGGDDVHYIEDAQDVDSIRMILEHVLTSVEEELAEVAKSAYNRAKRFSWERTARETLEVYKSL
jgi:alpha-1,3-rhamnosyl/mannosyltransferase